MFCSNCGSELADGSKFCSACGARVEAPTEHPVEDTRKNVFAEEKKPEPAKKFALDLNWDDDDTASRHSEQKVSFDWSSVIDGGRRKNNDNLRSPWEDDAKEEKVVRIPESPFRSPAPAEKSLEEELFGTEAPVKDRDRTMTFIDILKQERDDKERKAYEEARKIEMDEEVQDEIPEPVESVRETILPEDEREKTQGYTDLKEDIIAEMEKRDAEAVSFEQQLANIRAEREAAHKAETAPEPPQSFVDDSEKEFEKIIEGMKNGAAETPQVAVAPEAEVVEPAVSVSDELSDLEAELASILGEDSSFLATEEERAALKSDYTSQYASIDEQPVEVSYEDYLPQEEDDDEFGDVTLSHVEDDLDDEEVPVDEYLQEEAEVDSYIDEIPEVELSDDELEDAESDEDDDVEDDVDLFTEELKEDAEVPSENVEDEYDSYDEYFDYVPRGRASRAHRFEDEDDEDEDEFEESVDAEETAEAHEEAVEEAVEAEAEAEAEAVEEPAEDVAEVDDEIALLQKRLEELMNAKKGGTPVSAPSEAVLAEEAIAAEELAAEAAPEVEPEAAEEVVEEAEAEAPAQDYYFEEPQQQEEIEDLIFDDAADATVDALEADINSLTGVNEEASTGLDDYDISYMDAALQELAAETAALEHPAVEETVEEPVIVEPEAEAVEEPVPDQEIQETEDVVMNDEPKLNLDDELAQLGFDFPAAEEEEEAVAETPVEIDFTEEPGKGDTIVMSAADLAQDEEPAEEPMTIEDLENELFGETVDPADVEATKRIDKFYTLYRKNEEFQKLLDAEYDKLQSSKYENSDQAKVDAAEGILSAIDDTPAANILKRDTMPIHTDEINAKAKEAAEEGVDASKLAAAAAAATAATAVASAAKVEKKKEEIEEEEEREGRGGSILTVIAIIVAVLLVALLAIILILNFMPESGIAQQLNELIGNYTNFFAATDSTDVLL